MDRARENMLVMMLRAEKRLSADAVHLPSCKIMIRFGFCSATSPVATLASTEQKNMTADSKSDLIIVVEQES